MMLWLFNMLIFFDFIVDKGLEYLNVKNWKPELPKEAADFYDSASYVKAKTYQEDNISFSLIHSAFTLVLTSCMLNLQGFARLDAIIHHLVENPILVSLCYFGILGFMLTLVQLPFSWYHTFVIEEKYGFNKTTPRLFWQDLIKQMILAAVIGGILLSVIQWIYTLIPDFFWWIAALVFIGFTLFFATFYTSLLLPIFNQLKPLESGSLYDKIEAYARQVSFPLTKISVMDGSKRSSKANAFFSGLGQKKAIVLYDTLLQDHSEAEIVAILAHEVGHYKKKHIRTQLILSSFQIFLMCYLLGFALKSPQIGNAFGFANTPFHIGLIGFSILYGPISTLMNLFMLWLSRKNEFEADAYAKQTYDSIPMIQSLKKLSVKHLSNLTPHPWYVFFHYSHPPLMDRIKALSQ